MYLEPKTTVTSSKNVSRAVDILRECADTASPQERAELRASLAGLFEPGTGDGYPDLSRDFPDGFTVDDAYRESLPDLQNGPAALIAGARQHLQHVGISNFRLPVRYRARAGEVLVLETSVTGTVSLRADAKGINMSRLIRTFYRHAEASFSFAVIDGVLDDYLADLESRDARILMRFSYPAQVPSLRSGLTGWQYYDVALEVAEVDGRRQKILHLDYVYSSTCPCSLELSEHARRTRGQLATPHSQRSVARLSVGLTEAAGDLWIEDLIDACRAAIPTETQVMVKREDEQAFAELNAANPIFVEDAARLFCRELQADPRIGDYRVVASHQESLHSHDAVSVLSEGRLFDSHGLDPRLFATLQHPG